MRRVLAQHKYIALVFPALFLAELSFCAWAYAVGPHSILWLLLAGGLAGLIPTVLNSVALWRGHRGLREPGDPDRLAAAVRTAMIAYRIGLVAWIVPLAVGFVLEAVDGGGVYLIGIMTVIPIASITMSIHTSKRRLTRARDAVSQPLLGSGTVS